VLTVVTVHGTSGVMPEDMECRRRQVEQIFENLDGEPAANGARNVILGDFNVDPCRVPEWLDESSNEWNRRVGDGESASMWQSLSFGANYKAAYCMAVCPAGEEVRAPFDTDRPAYLEAVVRPPHAPGVKVAHSHRTNLAGFHQVCHGIHLSFWGGKAVRLVHLVQADAVSVQEAQAVVDAARDVAGGAKQRPPLGGNYHLVVTLAGGFQCGSQRGLRNAQSVELGCVEPVNASLQPGAHGGILLLLADGRECPAQQTTAAGEFHHPQANGSDLDICLA
jgi:hypothetical protein